MEIPTYLAVGKPGKTVVTRLTKGDLLETVIQLIKEHDFKSGTVSCIGGLANGCVNSARSFEFKDPKDVIVTHRMQGAVELGYSFGVFGREADNEVSIHLHGIIMNNQGEMRCGNLVKGENPIFMVDLVLQEIADMSINPSHA